VPPASADGSALRDYVVDVWTPWLDARQSRVASVHDALVFLANGHGDSAEKERAWWELFAMWRALRADALEPAKGARPDDRQRFERDGEPVGKTMRVRLEPSLTAPTVGELPKGQRFVRWSDKGEFVGIKVIGAVPANATGEFFVPKRELDGAAGEPDRTLPSI